MCVFIYTFVFECLRVVSAVPRLETLKQREMKRSAVATTRDVKHFEQRHGLTSSHGCPYDARHTQVYSALALTAISWL